MIDYNIHKTTNQERKQAMNNVAQKNEKSIVGAIKINEKEIGDHLNQLVRQSVEDTINSLLDAEADAICNAGRYQRSPDRLDTRAGSYKRKLLTSTGKVELTVPRLRSLPFETQIIKRYQTKQSSVEISLFFLLFKLLYKKQKTAVQISAGMDYCLEETGGNSVINKR